MKYLSVAPPSAAATEKYIWMLRDFLHLRKQKAQRTPSPKRQR